MVIDFYYTNSGFKMSKGKILGYIRVSTFEQNTDRQLDSVELDKVFIDKASGKDANRPKLEELLNYVREDDTVVVHSLDRLGRNLDDLRNIVNLLTQKNVTVKFLKENLTFTGKDSAMSKLMLSVMGAFAEFERALIKERQKEGIKIAQLKGKYKGRKQKLSDAEVKLIQEKVSLGISKTRIAKDFSITRATLYHYLSLKKSREGGVNSIKQVA